MSTVDPQNRHGLGSGGRSMNQDVPSRHKKSKVYVISFSVEEKDGKDVYTLQMENDFVTLEYDVTDWMEDLFEYQRLRKEEKKLEKEIKENPVPGRVKKILKLNGIYKH